MDHLHHRCQHRCPPTLMLADTAHPSRQQQQQRTNLLALKSADMLRHVLHKPAGTAKLPRQFLTDSSQIISQHIHDALLQTGSSCFNDCHLSGLF
ncbi:MAG: hypothetical protein ACK559_32830, partial [bacterium]